MLPPGRNPKQSIISRLYSSKSQLNPEINTQPNKSSGATRLLIQPTQHNCIQWGNIRDSHFQESESMLLEEQEDANGNGDSVESGVGFMEQGLGKIVVGYKPVEKPAAYKRVERCLTQELYQLQMKMSKNTKPILAETANFNLKQMSTIKSSPSESKQSTMISSKSKQQTTILNDQRQNLLITFKNSNLTSQKQTVPTNQDQSNYWSKQTIPNPPPSSYIAPTNPTSNPKPSVINRRSKTESCLLRNKQNRQPNYGSLYQQPKYHIMQKPVTTRYINDGGNPQPTTHTTVDHTSRPGYIRRQSSQYELQSGQYRHLRAQSTERLRQIRKQLHEIYNSHRQDTTGRADVSTQHKQQISSQPLAKPTNSSRNSGQEYGYLKTFRMKNEVPPQQNYRLLLEKSKNCLRV